LSQSRKQKIREDLQKQRRRRRTITTTAIAAIAMTAVIIIIILLQRPPPPTGLLDQPISQSLYDQLTGVSNSTLTAAINAPGVTRLSSVTGTPLTSSSKPEVLYIGAEYCPFCAAERWSIGVALAKFGSFTGLTYMLSGDSPESFPDTATLSFRQSSYTSQYVSFASVETNDRSPSHNSLQSPTTEQQAVWDAYDPSRGIPFLDIGGSTGKQYLIGSSSPHSGAQFSPVLLSGLNWTEIGMQLNNPSSSAGQAIDGAADTIISALCNLDGGAPSNVCSNSYAQIVQAPFTTGQVPPADRQVRFQISEREVPISWKNLS